MEYPELKRAVLEQMRQHNASVVLIEDKTSGQQLIQELRWNNVHQATPYVAKDDKTLRLHAQTAMIEGGFVFIPTQAPWLDVYLLELTTFPAAKHDDQTDSTSQFLDWFKTACNRPGVRSFFLNWIEITAVRLSATGR
jgi:predicted phage terminase large subunit-like protein